MSTTKAQKGDISLDTIKVKGGQNKLPLPINTHKLCSVCKVEKYTTEFYKGAVCKECRKENERQRRQNNKNRVLDPNKTKICSKCKIEQPETNFRVNRAKCHDCEKKYGRGYRGSTIGKQKSKEWNENNKDKLTELKAQWYQNNKEYVNEKNCKRYRTDEIYKKKKSIKDHIRTFLKGKNKNKYDNYLGCTLGFYRDWLWFNMQAGMTEENHGTFWHIDHVIPVNKFDLTKESDILACYNWRNTCPVFGSFNMSKHDTVNKLQTWTQYLNVDTYSIINKMEVPKDFTKLYAKHLKISGNPLEL
uniref:Uncharacterized protein n=1 Tax=viral metagenome TaxID=1070528 RepID=A0A6C0EAV1_9ZZZZ